MRKLYILKALRALLAGVLLLLAAACGKDDAPGAAILYGPETMIGEGAVRAWVKVTPDKKPLAVGVSISKNIIPYLPHEMTEYKLDFPEELDIRPYDHMVLDWNPHGHVPVMYEHPHFDMHFYMIKDAARKTIPAGPQTHTPEFAHDYMPATYTSGVDAVPGMGVHWVDSRSPELHGELFSKTFVYGAHHNKVIFYEPMITLAYLQGLKANREEVLEVPQARRVQQSGYHPQAYTILNDTESNEFTVSLTSLKYREAHQ